MTGRAVFALARLKFAVTAISALFLLAPGAFSATAPDASGSIAGLVRDSHGIPQMGASVYLFNRSERLIQQVITNERGIFGFASLAPDLYSVRVSLASFVPAVKQKIAVQPGMQSLLYVNLASVLSSIELVYAAPGQGALMSDDWKWTLKASASTRPVLRWLPDSGSPDPSHQGGAVGAVFSDTRGLLNVSAGDPGSLGGSSSQSDLGTAFAVATSMFGGNQLKVSGNVGYNSGAAVPAAGFRTSFSHDAHGPEIAVTVQQIYLPSRASSTGQADGTPALRTMSVSMHDSTAITDHLQLDYGASLDSVSFLDHVNYLSKYGRLSYDAGAAGKLRLAYSSGAPPVELMTDHAADSPSDGEAAALADDLNALSSLPRVSLLGGQAAVQRTADFEFGYEKRLEGTTVNFTAYRESVANAAMTMVAPDGVFPIGDVLPDISSRSSILDAGSYQRTGFVASAAQDLSERLQVGASFGTSGALSPGQQPDGTAADLRSKLQSRQRFWVSARASAKLPVTGTQISGSYQWMDYHDTIMPDHFYLTQDLYQGAGLNVLIRQPIPSVFGMPGRLEATAEVRNGLAQGYLPIIEGGQRVTLVQSPRALRGGLSFIF
jgi:Carboxypeptidase regulatory-like domain